MTQEQRLLEMEDKIQEVLESQGEINKKLDQVLSAIQGNQMSGESGIAKRLAALEAKEERRSIESARNGVWIKIMATIITIIAGLIITFMFNYIYTNKPEPIQIHQDNQVTK